MSESVSYNQYQRLRNYAITEIESLKEAVSLLVESIQEEQLGRLIASIWIKLIELFPKDKSFRTWDYLHNQVYPAIPMEIKERVLKEMISEGILQYRNGWAKVVNE